MDLKDGDGFSEEPSVDDIVSEKLPKFTKSHILEKQYIK